MSTGAVPGVHPSMMVKSFQCLAKRACNRTEVSRRNTRLGDASTAGRWRVAGTRPGAPRGPRVTSRRKPMGVLKPRRSVDVGTATGRDVAFVSRAQQSAESGLLRVSPDEANPGRRVSGHLSRRSGRQSQSRSGAANEGAEPGATLPSPRRVRCRRVSPDAGRGGRSAAVLAPGAGAFPDPGPL
jgi:hypothetical protein